MLNHLLLFRFLIANLLAAAGAGVLYWKGIVAPLFINDTSYISYGIAALFLCALGWTLREITSLSLDINAAKKRGYVPAFSSQRDKDVSKIEWLNSISGWLVALGLLGTVVGFRMALGAVEDVSGAAAAKTAVTTLMKGLEVAINTTLIGAVLALWNEVNFRMLKTALSSYWEDRILESERGEIPFQ